jgi:DNA primase catalytic core
MARIPEDEIEQLKSRIAVERLAEARGVKLKRHGKDLLGLCPFHDDREPSLVVTPEKNLWHCLGACQAGGTVIDWVMRAEGVSFRHAVELLRKEHPSLVAGSSRAVPAPVASGSKARYTTAPRLENPLAADAEDHELLERVVGYYRVTLRESPEALAYLEKRGLRNDEAIEHFRLGFANRTLAYRIPAARGRGGELRERLQSLGVLRESGHEHLNGSLVIPIFDEVGRVVGMYGRKVTESLRKGTPLHLYLPGPHRGVWNAPALGASKEIILCESLIDALTFWCAGYRNVTCAYGVEGFTDAHREAFRKHGTERVLIAYDRDEAGDRASEKLAAQLDAAGIATARVLFPKGMDANEYALKVQPAEKSLGTALRSAGWTGAGKRVPTAVEVPVVIEEPSAAPFLAADLPSAPELEPAPSPPVTPASPPSEATTGDEVTYRFGDRRWRIRGVAQNAKLEQLRVNLLVSREPAGAGQPGGFHVDTLELYSARQRASYVTIAAGELGVEERVVKRDLGEVLLRLEERQEALARAAKEPAAKKKDLTEPERREALELLRSPDLIERLLADFDRSGVVGERVNKLVGYLAATSRKLEQPLAIVIQSSSAAGKSSLMDAVLSLMPEEERVSYSAMTGQSLFYMGEADLQHKILAIAEEEGAERASYALKLLQSEGELTIASTGKDPATGRLVTQEYRVTGPVMIFLTTTAVDIDEELLNRCLVLTVDEGREQTRAIHECQREAQTLEGLLQRAERSRVMALHQNAQRLLRPLLVANPYARELRFIDTQTRTRRDFPKYLTLIRTIALLHQYQRELRTVEHGGRVVEYIEVTREDIALANRLCGEVLGRTLDELPPGTRRLLGLVDELVTAGCEEHGVDRADFRFSRREVRERTGWGNTQLKVHLGRLVEMEYVVAHRGKQGQGYVYELAWARGLPGGAGDAPSVIGEDAGASDASTTATSRGVERTSRGPESDFAGGGRPPVGPWSAPGRGGETQTNEHQNGLNGDSAPASAPNTRPGTVKKLSSYVRASSRAARIAQAR